MIWGYFNMTKTGVHVILRLSTKPEPTWVAIAKERP
jgi:hypothetical protein